MSDSETEHTCWIEGRENFSEIDKNIKKLKTKVELLDEHNKKLCRENENLEMQLAEANFELYHLRKKLTKIVKSFSN